MTGEIGPRPIADFLYVKRLHVFGTVPGRGLSLAHQLSAPGFARAGEPAVGLDGAGKAAAKVRETQLSRVLRAIDSSATALL